MHVLSDETAEKTALAWEDGGIQAAAHFEQVKTVLDAEDPSYVQ